MKHKQRTDMAWAVFGTVALTCAAWVAFPAGSRAQSYGSGTAASVDWSAPPTGSRSQSYGTGTSSYAGTNEGFQNGDKANEETKEEAPQASWNLSPTLAGGATASISGVDPATGMAFAMDGYYTPYGKDMKGGGFSVAVEGQWIGGRLTIAMCQGHMPMGKYKATTTMSYWAGDLYLRHALAKDLFVYAGVGVAAISYDYEYTVPADRINSSYQVGESANSDAMLSYYGGVRWRFCNPWYVFAEYRYDGDAEIELYKMDITLEGGGRAVVGGGFML